VVAREGIEPPSSEPNSEIIAVIRPGRVGVRWRKTRGSNPRHPVSEGGPPFQGSATNQHSPIFQAVACSVIRALCLAALPYYQLQHYRTMKLTRADRRNRTFIFWLEARYSAVELYPLVWTTGIEPVSPGVQAGALPLSYVRCTPDRIRTYTEPVLNRMPLPVGLLG
jgi:hypothetical protein